MPQAADRLLPVSAAAEVVEAVKETVAAKKAAVQKVEEVYLQAGRLRVECFRLQGARRRRLCGGRPQGLQRQKAGDLPQARGGQSILCHQRYRERKR